MCVWREREREREREKYLHTTTHRSEYMNQWVVTFHQKNPTATSHDIAPKKKANYLKKTSVFACNIHQPWIFAKKNKAHALIAAPKVTTVPEPERQPICRMFGLIQNCFHVGCNMNRTWDLSENLESEFPHQTIFVDAYMAINYKVYST